MLQRVSGIRGFNSLRGFNSRIDRLQQHLNRNDRVVFRFHSRKLTGRVVNLLRRAVIVSFELRGKEVTKPITYGSILEVLNR